jgi:glutaminyl-tRNA synthetase
MSKRKLLQLVQQGVVEGWAIPECRPLPGCAGAATRRRSAHFCAQSRRVQDDRPYGIREARIYIRQDLNQTSLRVMTVLRPLKLVLTNYPEGQVEFLEAVNNPEAADAGVRSVPFGRELWIEQEDFREVPPKGYYRLYPGNEVRLRYGYIIKCHDFVKDPATGEIAEITAHTIHRRAAASTRGK